MTEKLFSITLYTEGVSAPSNMYYRVCEGDAWFNDGRIAFKKGASVCFDTFFNCFSFSKYKAYTDVKRLEVELEVEGEFQVDVCVRRLKAHFEKKYKLGDSFDETPLDFDKYATDEFLYSTKVKGDGKTSSTLPLDIERLEGDGLIYFTLTCLSEKGALIDGRYNAKTEPINEPKIAIGICTYKRETFVLSTLTRIKKFLEDNVEYKDAFRVFVVDNGKTLGSLDEFNFARLIENKNLGGSGGFARAIMEIKKSGEFSHFLLMDDDIVLNPVALEKVYGLIAYASDVNKLAIGGGMMFLEKANCQYEFGGRWAGLNLELFNRNYNLSDKTFVALNEWQNTADYNAWYFACMPISITEKGLPLPLFIKCDDVDYGFRWEGDFLTMNGISVWHEDFDLKYSGELEYYLKRNEVIINALWRSDLGGFFHAKKLIRAIAAQIVSQRYEVCDLVFKAFNDFLKGPDFLLSTNAEALHAELRKMAPEQYSGKQLQAMGYDVDREYWQAPNKDKTIRRVLTLNGYLIPNCFYDKDEVKRGRLIRLTRVKPRYYYKSALTIQYNREVDKGLVTEQKRGKLFTVGFKLLGMCIKILFKYKKARKQFQVKREELTSWATWERLLELDSSNNEKE